MRVYTHFYGAIAIYIIYIYAYENLTRKFIHRRFVLYLLKLYRIPCAGCFNSEQFLIALKKVKRRNIYDITLETA